MGKITRKSIIATILTNVTILSALASALDVTDDEVLVVLNKWNDALNKTSSTVSKAKAEEDEILTTQIVPFIIENENPVTAKTINEKFIHNARTNKASAMLRRAIEMGLISRDRVRKNANFEYASPNFDWSSYINEYDEKVAAKAKARIENARKNRA